MPDINDPRPDPTLEPKIPKSDDLFQSDSPAPTHLPPSPDSEQLSGAGNENGEHEPGSMFDEAGEFITKEAEVPCEFITGNAGTGKTFSVKKKVEEDPHYAVMCASTGIAAVNLGGVTINSLLKYYDTASLLDNAEKGRLAASLAKIAHSGVRNIALDECSMTPAPQLDVIYYQLQKVNGRNTIKHPLGLIAIGDVCQLPPVKAEWIFKAISWPKFHENTTRLTKVWRQSDPAFLEALNALRRGDGKRAAEILREIASFTYTLNQSWDGTTLVAKNDQVDTHNFNRLLQVKGQLYNVDSARWGKQAPEWTKNIPAKLQLKIGAYVMILTNDSPEFTFCNGDTGHVEGFEPGCVLVRLKRNNQVVAISKIHRTLSTRDEPEDVKGIKPGDLPEAAGVSVPFGEISFDPDRDVWHIGGVRFMPLRLAYASTVHKAQGLTLDALQVDLRNDFMRQPAMTYTAISRVKSPQGLKLVGTPELLEKRCTIDPDVLPWV